MARTTALAAIIIALSLTLAGCSTVGSVLQGTGDMVSKAGTGLQNMR
jgi:predicted small secreted protein